MVKELTRPAAPLRRGAAPETAWTYFNGSFMPLADAKVGVLTHALNYGTGVFEGVRAYWNADEGQLYALHLREHFERLLRSCKILKLDVPHTAPELAEITLELLRRCGYREDCYLRPLAFKSDEIIGVRLHDLQTSFAIIAVPFGTYIDIDHGISCGVSSWRRTDDNAIPARAKITGSYVNAALAKTEAQEAGYDEAIVLTQEGHVSEGSAENLFIVRDGEVELYIKDTTGQKIVLTAAKEGEIFGELALLHNSSRTATAPTDVASRAASRSRRSTTSSGTLRR